MIPMLSVATVANPDAGGQPDAWTQLMSGGVVEGRVVAITQAGLVKLLLDGLPVSAAPSAPMSLLAGDRVALQRTGEAIVAIVRLASGQTPDSSLFQDRGALIAATLMEAAVSRSGQSDPASPLKPGLFQGGKAPPATVPAPGPLIVETEAQARAALLPVARAAVATQTPLPDLFVRLRAALDAPDASWPPSLRAAMTAVLSASFDAEAPRAGRALRERIEGSGVFNEARATPGAETSVTRSDLKANLLTLRSQLGEFIARFLSERGSPIPGDYNLMDRLAADAALSRSPVAMPVRAFQTAAPAMEQDEGSAIAAPDRSSAAVRSAIGDPTAKPATLAISAADGAPQLLRIALMRLVAARDAAAPRSPENVRASSIGGDAGDDKPAARPPLRGELQPLREAAPYDMDSVGEATERATSLLRQVDGALDRLRLLQFASLSDRALGDFEKAPISSRQWQVEVPLALPNGGHGALPLMIERDGARQGAVAGSNPAWRMRFTTDTSELGAIDVAVTLRGGRIDVRFWADRPETASLLEEARGDLSQRIESEAAPVEMIRCQSGRCAAPFASPPKRGQFMDVQS